MNLLNKKSINVRFMIEGASINVNILMDGDEIPFLWLFLVFFFFVFFNFISLKSRHKQGAAGGIIHYNGNLRKGGRGWRFGRFFFYLVVFSLWFFSLGFDDLRPGFFRLIWRGAEGYDNNKYRRFEMS